MAEQKKKITKEMVEKLLNEDIDESKYFIPKDYQEQEKAKKDKK
jgi:hypothetical protein